MSLKRFTSAATSIEAIQYDGKNLKEIQASVKNPIRIELSDRTTKVEALSNHGWVVVNPGDWVLQQPDGELYPCNAELFASKYTPALEIPAHLPEHMKRVFVEAKELDSKLAVLGKYLGDGGPHSSAMELDIQKEQFDHMDAYSKALHKHLALYKPT